MNRRAFKLLHVASFHGNVGDNASHSGFRSQFARNSGLDVEYNEFEIREVYWKQRAFDVDFVALANAHDGVIVGGGNYFELWVEHSQSGCSFDIDPALLAQIRVPLIFNALGVDPAMGASESSLQRFRRFLDVAIEMPNTLLSCRNDGSMETLQTLVGAEYARYFSHLPDNGFFVEVDKRQHDELDPGRKNILIQLAGDMPEVRFPGGDDGFTLDGFLGEKAGLIEQLIGQGGHVILVPHIFRDLEIISALLQKIGDPLRRRFLSVAPYLSGEAGKDKTFSLYQQADLVLGMRFHASVCAWALETPCIGLSSYRQISQLYREMEAQDFCVDVTCPGFAAEVQSRIRQIERQPEHLRASVRQRYARQTRRFHLQIKDLLLADQ